MRSKPLPVQSILQMPEKWAEGCQVPVHSPSSYAGIESEDRKEYRAWLMISWICQLLVTAVLFISLVNCGSGISTEGDNHVPCVEVR